MIDSQRDRQAIAAAAEPCIAADRRTLQLVVRLPYLWADGLAILQGLTGPASVYRSLLHLRRAGLVATVRPSLRAGVSPQLWHPTRAGLAVAGEAGGSPSARRATAPRSVALELPLLVSCYELLLAAVSGGREAPTLVTWERPWHRRYQRPRARQPVTVCLPAAVALNWSNAQQNYLLLPDLGSVPLRAYRALVGRLFVLRHLAGGTLPTLLIGTPLLITCEKGPRFRPEKGPRRAWSAV